jgi:hypothetical protein
MYRIRIITTLKAWLLLFSWIALRVWIWRQYVLPKRRKTSTGLHGVTSQKTVLFGDHPCLVIGNTLDGGNFFQLRILSLNSFLLLLYTRSSHCCHLGRVQVWDFMTSRHGSVGMATGTTSRVQFPAWQDVSLLHSVQTGSGAHPDSYPTSNKGDFPQDKAAEV